jgi:hypothetical protein
MWDSVVEGSSHAGNAARLFFIDNIHYQCVDVRHAGIKKACRSKLFSYTAPHLPAGAAAQFLRG